MAPFSKIAGNLLSGKLPMMPELSKSLASLAGIFGGDDEKSDTEYAVLALVKTILAVDGMIPAPRLDMFRQLAEETYGVAAAQKKLHQLLEIQPLDSLLEAKNALLELNNDEKEEIIRFLINLSVASDNSKFDELAKLAKEISIPEFVFTAFAEKAAEEYKQRTRILRSGTGLLVAIIVIAVFILTATLLRSVIFGLIAAYLLLPVEKFFEKRLRRKSGIVYAISRTLEIITLPLSKLSGKLTRKGDESVLNKRHKENKKIIEKAVGFTAFFTVIALAAVLVFATAMTGRYVHKISVSVRNWKQSGGKVISKAELTPAPAPTTAQGSSETVKSTPPAAGENVLNAVNSQLDALKKKFERLPLVSSAISYIEKVLQDPQSRNEILRYAAKKTGGLVNFATGLVGTIVAFVCDMLLTAFFALLFLLKFAEFRNEKSQKAPEGSYIVKAVFNGKWLPRSSEESLEEAQRIINGTLNRLKVWVRGYITLMLVDATVYSTLFYFLDVPYFLILGALAGCGILLPYIGPILSFCLTMLVTLATGDSSGAQLAGIIACYLIYNGIVEQFILYPAVIGESLGLTTLETIIVVLLGAIFAGIPGMILALPAASVVKYLVPRIYNCWNPVSKRNSSQ